jgi:hypothetical protein
MIDMICDNCGTPMKKAPSAIARANRHYCSKSCRARHMTGESAMRWAGGRHLMHNGYIRITVGVKQRVYEHRWVMEQHLGRRLARREQVHHLNGDKTDNRIENLELIDIAEHTRIHHMGGRWARKHDACLSCGTTERKHLAHGWCTGCHSRERWAAKKAKKAKKH